MPIYAPCHLIQSLSGEAGKRRQSPNLVVEDDENILNLLSSYLKAQAAKCGASRWLCRLQGCPHRYLRHLHPRRHVPNKFGIEIAEAMRAQAL